ncbi:fimbrial protein [Erwinia sp. CPCC 100877]|nr:fimbrial protein [Erwinia sp. CPCC 100877]
MPLIYISDTGKQYLRGVLFSFLAASSFIPVAQACSTDCSIDVNFTGVYKDETCEVVINNASSNEIVTLPTISALTLNQNGREAGSVPFDVTLKNCPGNRTITLFFDSSVSAADTETGNLVNSTGLTYSRNVQIRIRKEDSSQVVIDDATTGQGYIISSEAEPLSHRFTASYYAKGDSAVTAGKVHAATGIELVYK